MVNIMKRLIDNLEKPKRALLVGVRDEKVSGEESDSLAAELAGLADTLGFEIAERETVRVRGHNSRFGMGTGKAREIADKAAELGVDCVVFDRDISPSLQRNWEEITGIAVIDRQELIIKIFSQRARTREAELQVALAEQTYSLPRLSHKYIDLSRQRGGRYGTKGSGETRLETDRRLALRRIQQLREKLADVRKQRAIQRSKRRKAGLPSCALVGYTNSGKSSLLNALTLPPPGEGVLVEDKLFATLDPTVRRMKTGGGAPVLLIDTVGFIRRLPHDLVDAFRATLEEVALADILIHVLDASDPAVDRYYETTMTVLRDLEADRIPMIIALNKIDKLDVPKAGPEPDAGFNGLEELQRRYAGSIPVSAKDRRGLDALVRRIETLLSSPDRS
jgi:GTP-binding protein HflX